jgi:uncharacterized membrane protein
VLIMIQAHTVDSWTLPVERTRTAYAWAVIVGGMGAPLFLFLAGVSVAFAAAGRSATLGGDAAASRTVRRRGWQIFLYAFLFRLQSLVLSPGSPAIGLLKVDILNVMGPSIVGAAALWGWARGLRGRVVLLGAVTIAIAMLTPLVRATPLLSSLPDPVEWYFRPMPGRTNFTMFPWSGFVTAGAVVGLFLYGARDPRRERRVIGGLAAAGVLIAAAGYGASYLPPIYARTNFWTSSPTFFFLRTGILLMGIPLAWAWEQRPWAAGRWRPLVLLGVESLFVYWIHVEMVYGVLTSPLHRQLRLPWVFAGFALFSLLMLLAVVLKQRAQARWRARRVTPPAIT